MINITTIYQITLYLQFAYRILKLDSFNLKSIQSHFVSAIMPFKFLQHHNRRCWIENSIFCASSKFSIFIIFQFFTSFELTFNPIVLKKSSFVAYQCCTKESLIWFHYDKNLNLIVGMTNSQICWSFHHIYFIWSEHGYCNHSMLKITLCLVFLIHHFSNSFTLTSVSINSL